MVKPYLVGDVLDFGGNEGELKKFVIGKYTVVNYDHSKLNHLQVDTIVSLAVIEHLEVNDVYNIFQKFAKILKKNGRIFITTPTKFAKPILDTLACLHIVDKKNIEEHKHYWDKSDIVKLAKKTGFMILKYQKFQIGFNQMAIFAHK